MPRVVPLPPIPRWRHDAAVALALAAHQRTLAQLAGEGGRHVFVRKLALFAAGRWPLGYHRGRYHVF